MSEKAIRDGAVVLGGDYIIAEDFSPPISKNFIGRPWKFEPLASMPPQVFRAKSEFHALKENGKIQQGVMVDSHENLWFDKIYITPTVVDLGNVLSQQEFPVSLYNAYWNTHKNCTEIASINSADARLIGGKSAPFIMKATEEIEYKIIVPPAGNPTIDTEYWWKFPEANNVKINITGQRIILWSFIPQQGVVDTLSFNTEVLTSYSGKEQRKSRREIAHLDHSVSYITNKKISMYAQSLLAGWQSKTFGLPYWIDSVKYNEAIPAGTFSLEFDTTKSFFREKGNLVIYQDWDKYEICNIASLANNKVTFARATQQNFTGDIYILPMLIASIPNDVSKSVYESGLFRTTISWKIHNNIELTGHIASTNYKNKEVILANNIFNSSELTESSRSSNFYIDYEQNNFTMFNHYKENQNYFNWGIYATGKDEVFRLKQLIHALKGKRNSFFFPSGKNDMILQAETNAENNQIEVNNIDYERYLSDKQAYKHLCISFNSETRFYEIIGSYKAENGNDMLILDKNIGMAIPANSGKLQFMPLVRLDTDVINVEYQSDNSAIVNIKIIGVQDDL